MAELTHPTQILRMKQLVARLSISKSSIYDRLNPRSPRHDSAFPQPIKIGSATAFLAHEVDEYISFKTQNSRTARK